MTRTMSLPEQRERIRFALENVDMIDNTARRDREKADLQRRLKAIDEQIAQLDRELLV